MRQNLDDGIVRAGGELQVRRGKRDGADRLRVGLVHLMRHPRTVREGHGCGLRATAWWGRRFLLVQWVAIHAGLGWDLAFVGSARGSPDMKSIDIILSHGLLGLGNG